MIYERLDPNNKLNSALKQMTREHMEMYGEAGLRTLCLSCVELDPAAYNACATIPFRRMVMQTSSPFYE